MKKLFFFIATALVCFACNESKTVTVTVTNPTAMERAGEMVEVSMSDVTSKLQLADTAQIIVLDADAVSYTHLRAHETRHDLVCRLLLEKKHMPSAA